MFKSCSQQVAALRWRVAPAIILDVNKADCTFFGQPFHETIHFRRHNHHRHYHQERLLK